MAKEFTFVVRVLYEERDGLIYQIFQHNRKKGFRFIIDKRFSIYYRFKDLMNKIALPDVFLFVERVEGENDVVAIYKNINNIELKEEEHFFTLASFVAPSASCQYCVFKQEKNVSIEIRVF